TSEQEANNADVAYSMHLALAEEDGGQPLNENYGIFLRRISEKVPETGPDMDLIRSLQDPAVFTLPEGGYGIVATRIARGGGADRSEERRVGKECRSPWGA